MSLPVTFRAGPGRDPPTPATRLIQEPLPDVDLSGFGVTGGYSKGVAWA